MQQYMQSSCGGSHRVVRADRLNFNDSNRGLFIIRPREKEAGTQFFVVIGPMTGIGIYDLMVVRSGCKGFFVAVLLVRGEFGGEGHSQVHWRLTREEYAPTVLMVLRAKSVTSDPRATVSVHCSIPIQSSTQRL